MKVTKTQLKRIIRESISVLREAYGQPPEIERYLSSHGLEAGIDYDFGGDGVKRPYYLIALRLSAEELASMLDDEMYPDSPIRGRDLGTSSGPDGDYVTW